MDEQRTTNNAEHAVGLPKALLVDDEADILRALRRVLRKKFQVTATSVPEEALQHLAEDEYAVLLSDQRMPTMEGTELMTKARAVSPDTVRILLTGYADINAAMTAINQAGIYRFLQKPWNDVDLVATLCQAADHFALSKENERLRALTEAQKEQLKAFNKKLHAKVTERNRQITDLNQELSETFQGVIQVLARLAEMQSRVLSNHARRVATLSGAVGQCMGLSEKERFQLEAAATLHDIGKIGMDPKLLRKHYSVLSAEEKATLLTHATTGEALVRMIPHLEEAALFVRHHHECFDGTGFPDKLFGRTIPLGARIIAAVDAYDNALNNRKTFGFTTPKKARQYIQDCTPREFDPEVLNALLIVLHEQEQEPARKGEIEVAIYDLQPGMVLSRRLKTTSGKLVMPRGTRIDQEELYQLFRLQQENQLIGSVYVGWTPRLSEGLED